MNNLVSIYIPTKNRIGLLQRAIGSVLAQTYRPIELIIVSDGSTDGTCDYVRALRADIEIKLIHNEQSAGACAARNQALELARGEFVTGLDDDDMFLPHRIARFVSEWQRREHNQEHFSCLFDRRIIDQGQQVMLCNLDSMVTLAQIVSENAIGNQVFTTRQRMLAAGGFDTAMPAWQDWEMWVRLLQRDGPAYNIGANSYVMDVSHEFERITLKSADKIKQAARLFYGKHGRDRGQLRGILAALMGYDQIGLSLNDLALLLLSKRYVKPALSKLGHGKFRWSWVSSIA
jgi:glycosyltransferase involved in cell wall biosynthesis